MDITSQFSILSQDKEHYLHSSIDALLNKQIVHSDFIVPSTPQMPFNNSHIQLCAPPPRIFKPFKHLMYRMNILFRKQTTSQSHTMYFTETEQRFFFLFMCYRKEASGLAKSPQKKGIKKLGPLVQQEVNHANK